MKSIIDQFNSLFTKSHLDDKQILCNHWMTIRMEWQDIISRAHEELKIIEEKIESAGCDILFAGNFEPAKKEVPEIYNRSMSWKEKSIYVLRKFKKPMSTSEIADEIHRLEFTPMENKEDSDLRRRKIMTSISGIIRTGTKSQVKNPAVFVKVDGADSSEQDKFWLAGEEMPGES